MSDKKKNVFVSHHHKDDSSVDDLTDMLSNKGYQLRNSSIRAKPDNQGRLDKNEVSDDTIRRHLRMKIRWAGQVIVVIGKETYQRTWVDWEVKFAHQLGKSIIGVYENGLKDKVEIPENLKKYATSIVGWNSQSIIDALEDKVKFQNPDESPAPRRNGRTTEC